MPDTSLPIKRTDGGPAFPGTLYLQHKSVSHAGMSLRDWFAGQALAGLIANGKGPDDRWFNHDVTDSAGWAYQLADAMMAERSAML